MKPVKTPSLASIARKAAQLKTPEGRAIRDLARLLEALEKPSVSAPKQS